MDDRAKALAAAAELARRGTVATGGAKLAPDGVGLPNESIEDDVFRALQIDEVAAKNLRCRLELAINTAVALLEARGVPGQIEVNKVVTLLLKVDALACRVSANQDSKR